MHEEMPTVVLVHGAFAESADWSGVIEWLRARRSVEVVAVANPLRSLSGDAAYVRDVIARIGKPVVLVGHSYGGMVITEAAAATDSVVGLVYVCAFAPAHGESAFELSRRFPGSTLGASLVAYPLSRGGDELAIRQDLYHQQFAADVSEARAAVMAATQRPVTEAALWEGLPTDTPAWGHIPSWFVIGDQDLNLPPGMQRFAARRAGARGTREVTDGSHAVPVSSPAAVGETILEAVDAAMEDIAEASEGVIMDGVTGGGNDMRRLHTQLDSELELARDGEELAVRDDPDFVVYEAALHSLHDAVVVEERREEGADNA